MQTAFSSRPTARSRSRGQSGSSSRTRRMTTAGFAPLNGGVPVSSENRVAPNP